MTAKQAKKLSNQLAKLILEDLTLKQLLAKLDSWRDVAAVHDLDKAVKRIELKIHKLERQRSEVKVLLRKQGITLV